MSIAWLLSNSGKITVVVNGKNGLKSHVVDQSHPNYAKVKECIKNNDEKRLAAMLDISKAIKSYSQGKVAINNGVIEYNGEPVHNTIADRILGFMNEGLPFKPLVQFLENLMANPSKWAVDALYPFLEAGNFPITEDGCFLGYKAVNSDFRDKHSGKFDNSPGKILEVTRNTCDDDRHKACSYGFHVGTLDYAKNFGGGQGHMLIVKVNPKDVVSVPAETNVGKVRTCKYEVLSVYLSQDTLPEKLYSAAGTDANFDDDEDYYYDDYEDDYEECDYEDDLDDDYEGEYRGSTMSAEPKMSKRPVNNGNNNSKHLSRRAKKQRRDSNGRFC